MREEMQCFSANQYGTHIARRYVVNLNAVIADEQFRPLLQEIHAVALCHFARTKEHTERMCAVFSGAHFLITTSILAITRCCHWGNLELNRSAVANAFSGVLNSGQSLLSCQNFSSFHRS